MYMAVECDKYELPIAVGETAAELANIMGTTVTNIYSSVSYGRSGRNNTYRYVKVDDIREEDELN